MLAVAVMTMVVVLRVPMLVWSVRLDRPCRSWTPKVAVASTVRVAVDVTAVTVDQGLAHEPMMSQPSPPSNSWQHGLARRRDTAAMDAGAHGRSVGGLGSPARDRGT